MPSDKFLEEIFQCPDCLEDGKLVLATWWEQHNGKVCPECHRVYFEGGNMKNFHYTEEKFMRKRIKGDRQRRRKLNAITEAVHQRWLGSFSR